MAGATSDGGRDPGHGPEGPGPEAHGLDQPGAAAPERPLFTFRYDDVLRVEDAAIWQRRRCLGEPVPDLAAEPGTMPEALGLALSGGGIRSAAFSLGVLQGMDSLRQLGIDPLGKPTGDPVSLADTPREPRDAEPKTREQSVFDRFDYLSTVSGGGYIGASLVAAITANRGAFPVRGSFVDAEAPVLRHIRDNSNYLLHARGALAGSVAIYLRGLAVNLFLTLPPLLAFAALVIFYDRLWRPVADWPLAGLLAALLGLALIGWGAARSRRANIASAEIGGWAPSLFGAALGVVLFALSVQISAAAVDLLAQSRAGSWDLAVIAGTFAPLATLVGFLGPRLTALVQKLAGRPGAGAVTARVAGVVALWAGAALLPLLLWVAVLFLASLARPEAAGPWFVPASPLGLAVAYLALALLLFAVGQVFADNANSLHRLYRDRLSAAFLVRRSGEGVRPLDGFQLSAACPCPPGWASAVGAAVGEQVPHGLAAGPAPYLLVNAAVNIQNSSFANNRGRNADFFLFGRDYVGSTATGYVRTEALVARDPALDLATAIAASGAAVSSNMGANSIAPLTPTLALLNVRLGYWLPNPMGFAAPEELAARYGSAAPAGGLLRNIYFLAEAFGRLDERGPKVYVSDGGHIDNLGLFELLRRRCRLIVVVDAEADPGYAFRALVAVQRHARIDLGVRIELPWEAIAGAARACAEEGASCPGPHAAIGRILYSPGDEPAEGILVYIKASVSGEENDMIRGYRVRHPSFPHETTLDQLFSEEQFEVYRALGFHIANRLFSGKDRVVVARPGTGAGHEKAGMEAAGIAAADPLLAEVVALLRLPVARRRD
ncbi:patatin-like phospholipase family protein [Ancylobacter sp. Lp-2]|uniref:patatin-like phospholipase family protein n=1 Tax=Ancylobacter sp. Lp-2 TaxID=2881339 RepID=UPI001E364A2A|nr:patatin-like phospholipase family protein [Ancylobacter sp. Lp-2]MCB4770843.1 patatin-like phospholipase family protein [Ancylobacter sp. Lp-2]